MLKSEGIGSLAGQDAEADRRGVPLVDQYRSGFRDLLTKMFIETAAMTA